MVITRSCDGVVRFSIKPKRDARQVELAGDFTDWQPVPMRRLPRNRFEAVVPLRAGTYDYKFVIDGRWHTDPDHNRWALNPYGTVHSTVTI